MDDHQHTRAVSTLQHPLGAPVCSLTRNAFNQFWCLCGATVPEETWPRCTWCKRRHLPQSQWYQEVEELEARESRIELVGVQSLPGSKLIPSLTEKQNPDYPYWVTDASGGYPVPYPPLGSSRSKVS
jgi:hypothetical protein